MGSSSPHPIINHEFFQVAQAWAERGTVRRSKAAAKARWRMLVALVGFSLLASVFRMRGR